MELGAMDIATYATYKSQADTLNKVGTAVLSKALDTQEMQGDSLVKMIDAAAMERSVNPHIGGNFDLRV